MPAVVASQPAVVQSAADLHRSEPRAADAKTRRTPISLVHDRAPEIPVASLVQLRDLEIPAVQLVRGLELNVVQVRRLEETNLVQTRDLEAV